MSEAPTGTDDPQARINAPSAALRRLAEACGVSVEYTASNGDQLRCSVAAIRAVLAAMGIDASDDAACHREYDALEDEKWSTLVPPVTVVLEGVGGEVNVHHGEGHAVDVVLVLENGVEMAPGQLRRDAEPRIVRGVPVQRATFVIPADIPLGYHRLHVTVGGHTASGSVICTPAKLTVPDAVRVRRPWGFMTQLYSVRSARSWGLGDLADLRDLCTLSAAAGADFVLINPLHAAEPVGPMTPSPYLPTSRRWVNPMYIRVEDIPEVAYLASADRAALEWEAEAPHKAARSAALLDRDAAWGAKRHALDMVFRAPRSAAREASFQRFVSGQGWALEDFATWSAIVEARAEAGEEGPWPSELANPGAPGVAAFRDAHPDRVLFYAWLQWVADEQRADAQEAARRGGMSLGVMTDLAVGVHPQGADMWALGEVHAHGASVGAPPDLFNQQGQDWSQPPWHPRALADAAYRPFIEMVRASLRHSGAVRIDHAMGLFRLWWVPAGHGPADGAYVRYDHEAMVGIVALEAHRAGALVIGEDLGTVEPWVSHYLGERGILGTTVLWFEKDGQGARAPESFRSDALATVTTHDHPPTASFLSGEHVDVRHRLGLLIDPDAERAGAASDREAFVRLVESRGWAGVGADGEPVNGDVDPEQDLLIGLHRAVMASPSLLVGVSLADAVGEKKTQNQPGTDRQYPNWRIPLTDARGAVVALDDLFEHPRVRALVAALRDARS